MHISTKAFFILYLSLFLFEFKWASTAWINPWPLFYIQSFIYILIFCAEIGNSFTRNFPPDVESCAKEKNLDICCSCCNTNRKLEEIWIKFPRFVNFLIYLQIPQNTFFNSELELDSNLKKKKKEKESSHVRKCLTYWLSIKSKYIPDFR